MVDRVKITPNRLVCKDINGTTKFDSANRYVYTGGTALEFSFSQRTPQPVETGSRLADLGSPIVMGLSVGVPITYVAQYDGELFLPSFLGGTAAQGGGTGASTFRSSTPTVTVKVNGQLRISAKLNINVVYGANGNDTVDAAYLTYSNTEKTTVRKGDTVTVERFSENVTSNAPYNPTYFVFSYATDGTLGLGFTQ